MSGIPSPVSNCLLKRLEITEVSTTRIIEPESFNSFTNQLTLAIEGQHLNNAASESLTLFVRNGTQQLLSIRLTDLLSVTGSRRDIIAVDRHAQKLVINVPSQTSTIGAVFVDSQDFSMTVYLLEKFGFHINNNNNNNSNTSNFSQELLQNTGSPLSMASVPSPRPRISSFPLPSGGYPPITPQYQRTTSFESPSQSIMFSGRPGTFGSNSLQDQRSFYGQPRPANEPFPNTNAASHMNPSLHTEQMSSFYSQPNPYDFFVNRQNSNIHRPAVGSPLKNAFGPDVQTTTLSPQGQFSYPYPSTQNSLTNHAVSQSQTHVASIHPSSVSERHHSQETGIAPRTEVESMSTPAQLVTDQPQPQTQPQSQSSQDSPSQGGSDFRTLMPQPRKLPFVEKEAVAQGKNGQSAAVSLSHDSPQNKAASYKKPKSTSRPRRATKPTAKATASAQDIETRKQDVRAKVKPANSRDAKPNTDAGPRKIAQTKKSSRSQTSTTGSRSKVGKAEHEPTRKPQRKGRAKATATKQSKIPAKRSNEPATVVADIAPSATITPQEQSKSSTAPPLNPAPTPSCAEPTCKAMVFVADPSVLKQLNELTAPLIDQYADDVARGCDGAACAKFYLDQVEAVRRDFWHGQLTVVGGGVRVT